MATILPLYKLLPKCFFLKIKVSITTELIQLSVLGNPHLGPVKIFAILFSVRMVLSYISIHFFSKEPLDAKSAVASS